MTALQTATVAAAVLLGGALVAAFLLILFIGSLTSRDDPGRWDEDDDGWPG